MKYRLVFCLFLLLCQTVQADSSHDSRMYALRRAMSKGKVTGTRNKEWDVLCYVNFGGVNLTYPSTYGAMFTYKNHALDYRSSTYSYFSFADYCYYIDSTDELAYLHFLSSENIAPFFGLRGAFGNRAIVDTSDFKTPKDGEPEPWDIYSLVSCIGYIFGRDSRVTTMVECSSGYIDGYGELAKRELIQRVSISFGVRY